MSEEDPIGMMTDEECWEMLRTQEFGRLAYHLGDEVHLTPVNYAVEGETLLFRTGEGSKLLAVEMNPDVAFEIDEFDDSRARSVIVRGVARHLDEHEEHRAENVPLRPWVATLKYDVVEIRPTQISGRSFELSRPWLHMMPGGD
jgi:nitroimidazol reductase NimA-like FMN-containing flavoprotein (pyridoxamine 5'-phosphate oxidase superfamily)